MKLSIKDLAKKYDCSESGLRMAVYLRKTLPYEKNLTNRVVIDEDVYLMYKNDLGVKSLSDEEIESWYNLYVSGLSCKDIGRKVHRDPITISKHLKEKYNINPRDYFERYTQEEKDFYYSAYQEYIGEKNKSLQQIIKDHNIEHSTRFMNYIKRQGLKIKSLSEVRRLAHDENFFENIDSEIKAYLLGFFAADGHIEKRKDYDSYTLRIGVQLNDAHILKLYLKNISKDTVISCKENMATIAITSSKIGEDLLKMGYDNLKTYTMKSIPELPEDLMYHFIRGYFDGDGSIILQVRRSGKRLSGYNREFNITAYNKSILERIAEVLNISSFDINLSKSKTSKIKDHEATFQDCYSLRVNHKTDLENIYNKLYDNANYFFKRKRDKMMLSFLEVDQIEAALQGNL